MKQKQKDIVLNILIHSAETYLQRNYQTLAKPQLDSYKYDCQSLIDREPGTAIRLYFGYIELTFKEGQLFVDQRILDKIPHEVYDDFHSDHVQACLLAIEVLLLSN